MLKANSILYSGSKLDRYSDQGENRLAGQFYAATPAGNQDACVKQICARLKVKADCPMHQLQAQNVERRKHAPLSSDQRTKY
jgi:hypothetical protein